MEQKTKIEAAVGKQELFISREFDLPLETLFNAYVDPEIVGQWMGTKVVKLDSKPHGSYQFETSHGGKVVFSANGVIHECVPNEKITRTFEMENTPFPIQLEYYEFEKLTDNTSRLSMHVIYQSSAVRDKLLEMQFAEGINAAHNRLQAYFKN